LQGELVRPDELELPLRAAPQTVVWRQEPQAGALVCQVAKRAQLDESESARLPVLLVLSLRARQAREPAP
jgi:hypothetical protein